MGRPRKWGTDAERKAAARAAAESANGETPAVESADLEPQVPPPIPALPVGRDAPPLEDYVAAQIELVRRDLDGGLKDFEHEGMSRIERAEAYARWRWHGYVNGEVASL